MAHAIINKGMTRQAAFKATGVNPELMLNIKLK